MSTEKQEKTRSSKAEDILKLVSIIPQASELRSEKKILHEKRIRIRFNRELDKPIAKIPVNIANELGIKNGDLIEIIVAGKKKTIFTVEIVESSENHVLVYPVELEKQGISDNSIATIRKARI